MKYHANLSASPVAPTIEACVIPVIAGSKQKLHYCNDRAEAPSRPSVSNYVASALAT